MLDRVERGELTEADLRDPARWHVMRPIELELFLFSRVRRPIVAVTSYEELRSDLARVWVVDDRDRRMAIRVWMHPQHPGVPCRFSQVLHPAGYEVREATEDDGAALRELEHRVPVLRADGSTVTYNRPDPFAQLRLMGDAAPLVVEHDGSVVATHIDAFQDVRIAGEIVPSMYRLHTRALPEHQGAGLYATMTGFQLERFRADEKIPTGRAFAAVGNTKVDRFGYWDTTATQVVFECASTAAPAEAAARTAMPHDAAQIAALLDASHGTQELFVGATSTSVDERLTRSPHDYGYIDVLLGSGAVAGVWDSGWSITIERDGTPVAEQRLAFLADWGARSGAEDELLALVQQWCTVLAAKGVTHLFGFADNTTAAGRALTHAATSTTKFRHSCTIPEPTSAAQRGIYIDPIWF